MYYLSRWGVDCQSFFYAATVKVVELTKFTAGILKKGLQVMEKYSILF